MDDILIKGVEVVDGTGGGGLSGGPTLRFAMAVLSR